MSYVESDFDIKDGILIKYTGSKSVVEIPSEVYKIGDRAFYKLSFLSKVIIPKNVETIGENAFSGCSSLKSVLLSDGLQIIEDYAFQGCVALSEFEIPKTVFELGNNVFEDCSSLENINLSMIMIIHFGAFLNCSSLKNVVWGENLRSIEVEAFKGCSSLESVVLPNSVWNIEYSVFENCTSLSYVVLPKDLPYIDNKLFKNCSSLCEINLPSEISEIGYEAFFNCISLKKIIVPENVKSIYEEAFSGCVSLEEISIPKRIKAVREKVFFGCKNIKKFSIPEVMKEQSLSWWKVVFGDNNLYSVAIQFLPKSSKVVKSLRRYWEEASPVILSLKRIDLLLKYISLWKKIPLEVCERLIEMASDSGFSEGSLALIEYKNKVYPLKKIEKLQNDKLEKALGLKKLTVEDWKKLFVFKKVNGNIVLTSYKGKETDVSVPAEIGKTKVFSVADGCFRNCEGIKSVDISEGIVEIGRSAFDGCLSLEKVIIPDTIEKIADDAFYRCPSMIYNEYDNALYFGNENNPYLVLVRAKNQQVEKCVINEKTKFIYPYAFNGCVLLSSVNIPERIFEIGACAFLGCRMLGELRLPESLKKVGYCAFFKCDKLYIEGEKGSFAENIAEKNNIPFKAL